MDCLQADPAQVDESRLSLHLPLLTRLDDVAGSITSLFDTTTWSYRYLTRQYRDDLSPAEPEQGAGRPYFYHLMSKDDYAFLAETVLEYMEFLMDQPGTLWLFLQITDASRPELSPRERQVLRLVAQGYASRDIADYLRISVNNPPVSA